jgi:uncharacterized protein
MRPHKLASRNKDFAVSAVENAEPTMEEILASIRKIISDEHVPERPAPVTVPTGPSVSRSEPEPQVDWDDAELTIDDDIAPATTPLARPNIKASTEVLELTDLAERMNREAARHVSDRLMSQHTEEQAAQKLSALSGMMVRDYEGANNTLEALVRDMMKPLLKEWLDAHLPEMVDRIVTREIQRISGSNRS